MEETPEIVLEAVAPPPSVTARTLVRDAVLDLGAALGIGFGVILVVALVVFALVTADLPGIFASPWGIAAMLLATQLPLIYFARRRRRRNREKGRPVAELFAGPALRSIPSGVLAGLGLTLLSAAYSGTLQWLLGEDAVQSQVKFLAEILDNGPAVALLVLIIAVVAPCCEEFFFRGVIFGSGHAAGLTNAGMATSAVLFALVHLSPLLLPFYATFAWVICRLFARTGTLVAPVAAHMTMNGIACAALVFSGGRV